MERVVMFDTLFHRVEALLDRLEVMIDRFIAAVERLEKRDAGDRR